MNQPAHGLLLDIKLQALTVQGDVDGSVPGPMDGDHMCLLVADNFECAIPLALIGHGYLLIANVVGH